LNALQYLFLGLLIAAQCLYHSACIWPSPYGKVGQSLQVQLLLDDLLQHLIVEKCYFPVILMESLWKVLKVALSKLVDVYHGEQTVDCGLSVGVRLWCQLVDCVPCCLGLWHVLTGWGLRLLWHVLFH
jgi:hypothetical protein